MGIASCGLAAMASFGLCSLFDLPYGPMHSIIPCLLVGLGVDDMFVIVQALENVQRRDHASREEMIGQALRRAGVGVTVTSLTDVVVFAIGATTRLPSLMSYSLYTMLGILFTFALQVTFFVACLSLDQRRIAGNGS